MKKLITFLLCTLLCTQVYAQVNLQKVRINDFSGGMVSNALADLLEPNQGASMVNVSLDQRGKLTKRKGQSLFNKYVSSSPFTGVGRFDPDATTSYIVVASDDTVAVSLAASTEWRQASDSKGITTAGQDTEFVQANDLLFTLNGYDNSSFFNGASYITAQTYPSSPPAATTGVWLRNYLFLAGATTQNDWVYFSNNLAPTVFDATDVVKINTGDGQKIQKMLAYRLNEIIIYKERSIFVLDITGNFDDGDWTVQPISTTVGTIAPRSVVSLGNDQWFLSNEPIAIRSLKRTNFDKILVDAVSLPVQDIFDGTNDSGFNINKSEIDKAAAVLFDNKYIIAFSTGSSEVNNTVLVHDFKWNAWYLIKNWFPASWIKFNNSLYYIDANDGRVLKCFSGTTGDFREGPEYLNSASVPNVGIEWVYQTKSLDFDNQENYKQSDSVEVEADPTGDFEMDVYINLDNEGWSNVGDLNLAGQSITLPVTLPTTLQNSGVARETFHTQQYGEFKKMKVMAVNRTSQETVTLQRMTVFGSMRKWRRE